jgi:hypothetical protein
MTDRPLRNRIVYGALIVIATGVGIQVRRHGDLLPDVLAEYAPQVLRPMALFAGLGLIFRSAATWQVASGAYILSALLEFSELYQEPWIEALRGTPLGALTLGTEFLNTDLAFYALGVLLCYLLELWTLQ